MTLQEHKDEVMDWLDIDKIAYTMKVLDWKYYDLEVPDKTCLRKKVRDMMDRTYAMPDTTIGSGGFEVRYDKEHDSFDVKFVVTDWSTND